MPVYEYRGITAGNRATRGLMDASSLRAAKARLREEGIFPTEISEGRARGRVSGALASLRLPELRRVPALDLALFTRQLSTLLGSGVPLVESLSALTEQAERDLLKRVIAGVRESVNQGASLADALSEHPRVFSDLYCGMVRAGESSGALEVVLQRLADYIESQMNLRNQITNAMIYPALMISMSGIVTGVLLVKVIPTITGLLEDLDQPLPVATLVVIGVSEFLRAWWAAILASFLGVLVIGNRLVQTERGRLTWDRFRLRVPLVGRVLRHIVISRFSRTLATLLSGGLPIIHALDVAKSVANNAIIGRAVEQSRDAITRGASIAAPLRQSGEFPPMVTHMIAVGEASGELDQMLEKVAETYDELVENSLNRLTSLMGPILLILVAGVVVMIILSTLLPLMNLTAAL
ncbi:MAG: type II secretion system inner membrane protein GspF [Myxococcota bacterium]